jgi:uncharacterized membrane protein
MKKDEFLRTLKIELKKRKHSNTEEILYYYDEIIQDAVDAGDLEQDVVARLGSINEIVKQVTTDETFISKVKEINRNSLNNILSGSVKLLSNFIYIIFVFTITVAGGSIMLAGGGIIIQTAITAIVEVNSPIDYLISFGLGLIGFGLILIGLEIIKQFISFSNNLRYTIIRKTKLFFEKKEGDSHE